MKFKKTFISIAALVAFFSTNSSAGFMDFKINQSVQCSTGYQGIVTRDLGNNIEVRVKKIFDRLGKLSRANQLKFFRKTDCGKQVRLPVKTTLVHRNVILHKNEVRLCGTYRFALKKVFLGRNGVRSLEIQATHKYSYKKGNEEIVSYITSTDPHHWDGSDISGCQRRVNVSPAGYRSGDEIFCGKHELKPYKVIEVFENNSMRVQSLKDYTTHVFDHDDHYMCD